MSVSPGDIRGNDAAGLIDDANCVSSKTAGVRGRRCLFRLRSWCRRCVEKYRSANAMAGDEKRRGAISNASVTAEYEIGESCRCELSRMLPLFVIVPESVVLVEY